MITSRRKHNSCVLGNHLYVCGGVNEDGAVTSIERLAIEGRNSDEATGGWEILDISHQIHEGVMTPLSSNEILLLRGHNNTVVINVDEVSKEQIDYPFILS